MSEEHPWRSAGDEFEQVVKPKLEKLGKQIRADSQNTGPNCGHARDVIRYYEMLYRCFDPMTLIQLKEALEKYEHTNTCPTTPN